MGTSILPGILFTVMSDVNVVLKEARTILSDGINKSSLSCGDN
jgi:hypothetical protein